MADQSQTTLTEEDFDQFRDAVSQPGCPTPALIAAVQKHRNLLTEDEPHQGIDAATQSDVMDMLLTREVTK
jgi:predicted ABC-type transport system involved in lysophospholipase L1 biosynthesis ATPase subunit